MRRPLLSPARVLSWALLPTMVVLGVVAATIHTDDVKATLTSFAKPLVILDCLWAFVASGVP